MRIIGGELGGRKIHPPNKMPHTRPTTDIAKEGLFNIIENNLDISELKTLDLFGGTGSISFELASRGSVNQTIVEKDGQMFEFIKKTGGQLKLENLRVIRWTCSNSLSNVTTSLILFLRAHLMLLLKSMNYRG
jgi:16S rRNA G966 N2-methylase RsmD